MADIRRKMEDAASKLFKTFEQMVKTITLTNIVSSDYNPRTQETENVVSVISTEALITQYNDAELKDINIHQDDVKVTIRVSTLPSDFVPDTETKLSYNLSDYNIVRTKFKSVETLLVLQARKS